MGYVYVYVFIIILLLLLTNFILKPFGVYRLTVCIMETVSFVSPREVTIKVIQSRFNLFWWEAVEIYEGIVLRSLGQFRSESEAVSYIKECHLKNN